jgi:segregation and condensation protein B
MTSHEERSDTVTEIDQLDEAVGESDAGQPEPSQTEASQPETGHPETVQPDATGSESTGPSDEVFADVETPADTEPSADAVLDVHDHVDEAADKVDVEDELIEEARPLLTDPAELRAAVEAVLFVVESPIEIAALAAAFELTTDVVATAVDELADELDARGGGVELRRLAGGVRMYTRPAYASWVETFLLDGQRSKLSQAALETLAVIAYRQPVTRARVSAIRGVNVDGVVRTLLSRGLITEVGADPDTGGGLYRTTDMFLEKMGLQSLEELPSLAPLLPDIDGLDIDEL